MQQHFAHLCAVDRLVDQIALCDEFAVRWWLALAATRAFARRFATLRALAWLSSTNARAQLMSFGVAEIRAGVWIIAELSKLPAVAFLTIGGALRTAFAEKSIRVAIFRKRNAVVHSSVQET